MRTQTEDDQANDDRTAGPVPEPEHTDGEGEQPALRLVQARRTSSAAEVVESVVTEVAPPQIQREAWAWALAHRHDDGSLPSGQELAEQFGRKPRWGRLVKQRGEQGYLCASSA